MNGFCEAIRVENTTKTVSNTVNNNNGNAATDSTTRDKLHKKTTKPRKTTNIGELLNNANQKEQLKEINKVSATLSEENILPEGPRT